MSERDYTQTTRSIEEEIESVLVKVNETKPDQITKSQGNNKLEYVRFRLFLMQLSLTLPLIMMNAPLWIIIGIPILVYLPLMVKSVSLHIVLFVLYDIARPILYVWGVIATAQGKQDFFAIAFYIIAGMQALNIIKKFVGTICTIMLVFINDERSGL